MRYLPLAFFLLMMGCGAFGIATGPDGQPISDGKGGIVGAVAGTFWPWLGTLIAGAAGTYVEVKRRNWKAATVKTVQAVEEFKATPEGSRVWDKLKNKLVEKHGAKVSKLVDSLTPDP